MKNNNFNEFNKVITFYFHKLRSRLLSNNYKTIHANFLSESLDESKIPCLPSSTSRTM